MYTPAEVLETQTLAVTHHNGIYPGVTEERLRDAATGRVVFITGAAGAVGKATALAYARAGAAALYLTSLPTEDRELSALAATLGKTDTKCKVLHLDVTDKKAVEAAIADCIQLYGQLDILLPIAGVMLAPTRMIDMDPDRWWLAFEVNVKGTYNVVHYGLPHIIKSKGYIVLISSIGAQSIRAGSSSYFMSKHVVNRLGEFIDAEHRDDGLRVFAIHPGAVLSPLASNDPRIVPVAIDPPELSAAGIVRLTSGSEDYLSGRWVSCNWDLDEVATKYKDRLARDPHALNNRLLMP